MVHISSMSARLYVPNKTHPLSLSLSICVCVYLCVSFHFSFQAIGTYYFAFALITWNLCACHDCVHNISFWSIPQSIRFYIRLHLLWYHVIYLFIYLNVITAENENPQWRQQSFTCLVFILWMSFSRCEHSRIKLMNTVEGWGFHLQKTNRLKK